MQKTDVTPAAAAAALTEVPGVSAPALAVLRAVMPLAPDWDVPFPLPIDTAEQVTGLARRTQSGHIASLESHGLISISTVSRVRHISLNADAILSHISTDVYGQLYGQLAAGNPPIAPTISPILTPTQCREMKPVTPHANAACDGLLLYRILEYKNNIRIYIPSFSFLSADGLQIDISETVKNAGLEDLRPFGQRHSWKFDFTELASILLPDVRHVEHLETAFPDFTAYNWHCSHFTQLRRDFFIMSITLELACFMEDCFAAPWELSARGDNFDDFWVDNQQGIIFACLRNCAMGGMEECDDLRPLRDRIKRAFRPAAGAGLLDYSRTAVRNELVRMLNSAEYAQYCLYAFNSVFSRWAETQGYINYARAFSPAHPQWLSGIWGPDLTMGLACREYRWYQPRLSAPMVLMRTLAGMNHVAGFEYSCDENSFIRAYAMLLQAFNRASYRKDFEALCQELHTHAPYLPRLFDCVKGNYV